MNERISEQMVEANKETLPPWLEEKEVPEGTIQKTYVQTPDDIGEESEETELTNVN